ncbi:MAG TPA: glycosyltransferase [Anaerolineales bacterium]|nr:glycosyltransferase [Anaerolineales bacterium]
MPGCRTTSRQWHSLCGSRSLAHTFQPAPSSGRARYAEEYKASLKKLAGDDPRIIFTGYVFGEGYQELGSNAYLFVESSGVGGTHPALVEAMAFGNCVIVHNTPENLETIGKGEAGLFYDGRVGAESLREVLVQLMDDPRQVDEFRRKGQDYARSRYSWDAVTDDYERLFFRTLRRPLPDRLSPPAK